VTAGVRLLLLAAAPLLLAVAAVPTHQELVRWRSLTAAAAALGGRTPPDAPQLLLVDRLRAESPRDMRFAELRRWFLRARLGMVADDSPEAEELRRQIEGG
jgi:hypothetical protein